MNLHKHHRRTFLQSLSAAGLALSPLARSLRATLQAEAAGELPMRVVFFLHGNGIYPPHIQPAGIELPDGPDALVDRALAGHALPAAIAPLEPFKDRLTIVHGLSGRVTGPALHSADFGTLGCYSSRAKVFAETIDGALAKQLPGVFPHVGLGVSDRAYDAVIYNVSASGRGKALPTQCQPGLAFQRLFAGATTGDARKAFDAKTNVLDFLAEDVRGLRPQLGAAEREKLDYYLGAFEAMGARQAALAKVGARVAARVGRIDPADLPAGAGGFAHLDAQFEIAANALIAGLTPVVTVSSGSGMEFIGIQIDGSDLGLAPGAVNMHGVGHGSSFCGRSWEDLQIAIQRRHVEALAGFLKQLEAVPEGAGTMLDNTLVVYLSDQAERHHPQCFEWPIMLIGDLGGRLKTRGRYLRYPWYQNPGHRTVSNLFTAVLHAVGAPRDRFGVADDALLDLEQDGPLEELLS